MKKLKIIIPFILLFTLLGLLWRELVYAKVGEIPSALIGEDLPSFQLTTLYHPEQLLTEKTLRGRVILLNVWATWCYACTQEQPMLMKIKNQYHVPLYSIDYKDNPVEAKQWLQKYGNPYILIGNDNTGDTAIDLGVYGTPETFVISPSGKIVYRHIGTIDQHAWDTVLYPLVKKYEKTQ
jgi:cytochrome c biogenesis protein CcmG/thiol:disulfide interchange protein DsbE